MIKVVLQAYALESNNFCTFQRIPEKQQANSEAADEKQLSVQSSLIDRIDLTHKRFA